MKTVIIANPKAAAGRVQQRWQGLNRAITAAYGPAEVHFTECKGDATQLCRRAIQEGAQRIIAVGGDGTLNEIVNGFYDTDEAGTFLGANTTLVVFPGGTGGDFARSLGFNGACWNTSWEQLQSASSSSSSSSVAATTQGSTHAATQAAAHAKTHAKSHEKSHEKSQATTGSLSTMPAGASSLAAGTSEQLIDVGRATFRDAAGNVQRRYFINVSSFGVSGVVVEKVENTTKRLGGTIAFAIGTLRALWSYRNQPVRLIVDGELVAEKLPINTVAVANGRSFGGGMRIAPNALLNDGLFDVVVVGEAGLWSFLRDGYRLYRGTHLNLPFVQWRRGKSVIAEPCGSEPILIDMDGEQPGQLPVRYDILPAQLRVCAPWHNSAAIGMHSGRSTAASSPACSRDR